MDRRTVLSASVGAAALVAGGVHAVAQHQHDHTASKAQSKVATTAGDCMLKGQECIDHCITVVKSGDVSLADCMRSVEELVAACNALRVLAISNSKDLPVFAKAVAVVCKSCETECRKHDRHAACKTCGEACTACIDAIRGTFS
jgi:Cys-rich four helix bundle protein (predicted Tat secretion target)